MTPQEELLRILVLRSYLREAGRQFRLASGRLSDYYIECSLTTTYHAAAPLIGALIHGLVPPDAVAVGGPTMGADPLAAAVCYHSARTSRPLSWFSVRKTAKAHGARRWLEGSVVAGDAVVVVEDVITSGSALVDAVRKCGEEGLRVLGAVVLVDREEDDAARPLVQPVDEAGLRGLGVATDPLPEEVPDAIEERGFPGVEPVRNHEEPRGLDNGDSAWIVVQHHERHRGGSMIGPWVRRHRKIVFAPGRMVQI